MAGPLGKNTVERVYGVYPSGRIGPPCLPEGVGAGGGPEKARWKESTGSTGSFCCIRHATSLDRAYVRIGRRRSGSPHSRRPR